MPGLPAGIATWTPKNDRWALCDLNSDFSQAIDRAADHGKELDEPKQLFDAEARANRAYPIGGGLWSIVWSPQSAPQNPATEFHFPQDVTGVPEFASPKLGARSHLVTVDLDVQSGASGVVCALGAYSGGLALWIDGGRLHDEYNLFQIERTRLASKDPLPTGKVKIEVETRIPKPRGPAEITIRVDGKSAARGTVPRSAALGFTANDAFDVGMDSDSPLTDGYVDRKPFRDSGTIRTLDVRYRP